MAAALTARLVLVAAALQCAAGLSCHVCRSQPDSAAGPAAANSTLGLILTLALHSPPDCARFSAADSRFRTQCPLGLNSTCAVAEDAAGRRVRTCFGAARGAHGCFKEPAGTFCLCRGELCNGAGAGGGPLTAALVASSALVLAMRRAW